MGDSRVLIRMILLAQRPIRFLDLSIRCPFVEFQQLVKVFGAEGEGEEQEEGEEEGGEEEHVGSTGSEASRARDWEEWEWR